MIGSIQAALDGKLAGWSFQGDKAWEGVPYTPIQGRPYVRSQMTRDAMPMSIGPEAPYQWNGAYVLTLAFPTGEGLGPIYDAAQSLRNHFYRGLSLPCGSAQLIVMRTTAQPSYPAADWINLPVVIEWITEEHLS